MDLEKFRTPDLVTVDVDGAKYQINLPTRWNKGYQREWQLFTSQNAKIVDGKLQFDGVTPVDLQTSQKDAFINHCIASGPIVGAELRNDYAPLLDILFDFAVERASALEAVADDAVGKLQPISDGFANGKATSASMRHSKNKGVSQKVTESRQ